MFRKSKIILLLGILALLIGIFFIIKTNESEDRTFRSKVLTFTPQSVSKILIHDYSTGDDTKVSLKDGEWVLSANGREYNAMPEAVRNAIVTLNQLHTESVVATSSDKWEEYKVDKNQAIHVEVFAGSTMVGDLYIGKFSFKQIPATEPGREPTTVMTSFVRPAEEENIYAVNGTLRINFQGGITSFRDRSVFVCNQPTDITQISIDGPDEDITLDLSGPVWTMNGQPLDSAAMVSYLRSFSRLRNTEFLDEVDVSSMEPDYTLTVEGKTFDPVTIMAYPADSTIGYYLTSSMNPGNVFDGSKNKMFEKVFVGTDTFEGSK